MKRSYLIGLGLWGACAVAVGCGSDADVVGTATPDAGGTTPVIDSGKPGETVDSSSPATDAGKDSAVADAGADSAIADAGADSAIADAGLDATVADTGTDTGTGTGTGDAGSCAPIVGNFLATAVSCNGTPLALPAGFSWAAAMAGATGSFTTTINGCALTTSGSTTCTATELDVMPMTSSCNPAACPTFGAQCTQVGGSEQVWGISAVTATTFVLTTMNEPDGAPSPIKTCTAQGKSNPVQVTWTKQP